jgi:hypothetical protein
VKAPVVHFPERPRVTGWRQLNPLWLLDDDLDRPAGVGRLAWAWRQKQAPNLNQFVLGVRHRFTCFSGSKTSDGIFADGWQVGVVYSSRCRLPLVSYRGRYVEFYLGWRPSGALGWAFRKAHASPWKNP